MYLLLPKLTGLGIFKWFYLFILLVPDQVQGVSTLECLKRFLRHACAVLVSEARQSKVFEMLKIDEAIIDIWIIIFSSLMNIGGQAIGPGGGGFVAKD